MTEQPCRICSAADAHIGSTAYAEFCSDEHSESSCLLAEAIGAAIWGDDPCPPENLAAHVEDAVSVIAERGSESETWEVWMLDADDLDALHMDGQWWRDFTVFAVQDDQYLVDLFGIDPTEEGMAQPRPLGELIARRL